MSLANTGDQYTLNINISGTVVANGSCTFNQGGTLYVDFGDVKLKSTGTGTVQLDGDYTRPLTSDFHCMGDTAGLLQMEFTSASAAYEVYNGINVLGTDRGVVGIQLLVNGTPQTMGAWFSIDQASPPTLQAQLVQLTTSSGVVSGDLFTASGTLTIAFN
ncbi:fimbrial protein [Enterobacter sichuanensis]|uniref:fimbrial protein n=1 Tax=Enterobacter sichuanensis TaxID=2071710 RepID=UPI00217E46A0|nr:fimbrial protein [Enterobacter sichuanensis]